jgi:hypothetical protein
MSSSQRQFDFFGFLGKYVNFQELEETKFLTTSDTEFLQILFHFKWHLEEGLNPDKGQCKDKQNHFYKT